MLIFSMEKSILRSLKSIKEVLTTFVHMYELLEGKVGEKGPNKFCWNLYETWFYR